MSHLQCFSDMCASSFFSFCSGSQKCRRRHCSLEEYVREKTHCIDVILIEVHMPYVDSLQFLQHVTNETNVPVIMMSLDDAQSTVMKAIRNGACNYWLKPLQESLIKVMWMEYARKLESKYATKKRRF
ncbi:hypothetical protein GLYMA_19G051800v4 [Glycine max]|uniref:Two-component response regulator ARR1 isoform A n=1 Tax=Glycine soja TaxID=3848 RepID=A0A445FCK2_GLYSO|nr:hypothetical protein GLYMA_19G051800v4 [Glycine max]KAG4395865.1 hypothetical protein GLYMA_19G051800v4 [Glycine max]KAH1076480.1 hypothetical protein GYH30_052113 [Glycine max]KAH1076482.1 hypothetical protein GYH30_052113 [Glycine max]RZB46550.1 Two-component response regulator ARR1 isoform A [Glycine soja]